MLINAGDHWPARGFSVILLLCLMGTMSACVPMRPSANYPVAVTVVGANKGLAFVQCAAPELDVLEMEVFVSGVWWSEGMVVWRHLFSPRTKVVHQFSTTHHGWLVIRCIH